MSCTNPVQTYVDLFHCGGRGTEAAEAVLAGGADIAFYVGDLLETRTGHARGAVTQVLRASVGRIHQGAMRHLADFPEPRFGTTIRPADHSRLTFRVRTARPVSGPPLTDERLDHHKPQGDPQA
jgi:hypothetical protein